MIGKLLSITIAMAAATILAASAASQVRKIPHTGCPNAAYPTTAGTPAIGKGFGVLAAPCRTAGGSPFLVIGRTGPSITLGPPLACTRGCVLACSPSIVLFHTAAFRTIIPNDKALVGLKVCFQTGCVEAVKPRCVLLHGALQVQITH